MKLSDRWPRLGAFGPQIEEYGQQIAIQPSSKHSCNARKHGKNIQQMPVPKISGGHFLNETIISPDRLGTKIVATVRIAGRRDVEASILQCLKDIPWGVLSPFLSNRMKSSRLMSLSFHLKWR